MFNMNNLETVYREKIEQTNLVNMEDWKVATASKRAVKLPQLRQWFVAQKPSNGLNAVPCCA